MRTVHHEAIKATMIAYGARGFSIAVADIAESIADELGSEFRASRTVWDQVSNKNNELAHDISWAYETPRALLRD